MATLAIGEIVRPESSPAIMTAGATRNSRRCKVHRRRRHRDLPRSRNAGPDRMAARAVHRLQVSRVAKVHSVRAGGIVNPYRSARRVARVARPNVSAADLPVWPVALEACRMGVQLRRHRECYALSHRLVTSGAVGQSCMASVIKIRRKALQSRKALYRSGRGVCMAHIADAAGCIVELLLVTT